MKPPLFVFVHLYKSGGTTVTHVLRRNLGGRFRHDHGLLHDDQYTLEQNTRIVSMYPQYDCLASHRFSFALPFSDPATSRTVQAFTFVRDPVERALSHYFFCRQHPGLNPFASSLDLVPYFERFDREATALLSFKDGQTSHLAGPGGLPRIEELARAGHALVLPLSRFDDALLVLESRFPQFFPDCSYFEPKNRTARDQPVPDEVRALITRHQRDDFTLCQLAERELDSQLLALFPDPAALAAKRVDFARRKSRPKQPASSRPAPPPPAGVWQHLRRWLSAPPAATPKTAQN